MNSTQQQHYYDVASNLDALNVRDAIGRIFGDAVVGVVHRVQDPAGEAAAYANLFVDEGRTAPAILDVVLTHEPSLPQLSRLAQELGVKGIPPGLTANDLEYTLKSKGVYLAIVHGATDVRWLNCGSQIVLPDVLEMVAKRYEKLAAAASKKWAAVEDRTGALCAAYDAAKEQAERAKAAEDAARSDLQMLNYEMQGARETWRDATWRAERARARAEAARAKAAAPAIEYVELPIPAPVAVQPVKRGPGRPHKHRVAEKPKRPVGRPRKNSALAIAK